LGSHSGAGGDADEGSHTQSYYFGPSTVAVSCISGMIDNGYFTKGMGREPREETVSEPNADKVVVFEEFFSSGLRMPPHPVFADILLKFQVQIHQLTPNATVQFSKYSWVVTSFGGIPSVVGFAKRYELHYQPRKIEDDRVEEQGQYGCLNFHSKRGSQRSMLTVAIKNKWSKAWTQAWFHCRVPLLRSPSPDEVKAYMPCTPIWQGWIL
jgi:hypothetical protein